MNSHTKPRHEDKQDLIYLLPGSQQMPGGAGSIMGRGGDWEPLQRDPGLGRPGGEHRPDPLHIPLRGLHGSTTCILHPPNCPMQRPPEPPHRVHGMGTVAARAGTALPAPSSSPHRAQPAPGQRQERALPCTSGRPVSPHRSTGAAGITLETAAWGWLDPTL